MNYAAHYPIVSIDRRRISTHPYGFDGCEVSTFLYNGFGHFLENRLGFVQNGLPWKPYVFRLDGNRVLPSNDRPNFGDAVYVYMYFHPGFADPNAPPIEVTFPEGSISTYISWAGRLYDCAEIRHFAGVDSPMLVRVPYGAEVMVVEAVGHRDSGYSRRTRRIRLCPNADHMELRLADRAYWSGWSFRPETLGQSFPTWVE